MLITNDITRRSENKITKISEDFKKKYKESRILVRKSGTEPLIRILVEAKNKKNALNISYELTKLIKKILNAK